MPDCHTRLTGRSARCTKRARPAIWDRWRIGVCRLTVGERYLTQIEAARRAGVSKDCIIRARRAGRLPGSQLVDGRWMIPGDALTAAGLTPTDTPDQVSPEDISLGDDDGLAVELAAAQTQVAALRELVDRQDDELKFLRQLLADALAGRRDS